MDERDVWNALGEDNSM